jgi:Plasmid encoded RepA protein
MTVAGRPRRTELDVLRAAAGLWDQDEQDIGYLARLFTQTSLPYKDPGDMPAWGRRNGALSLTVQPGMVTNADGSTRSLGYPFGTVPRLLLTWLSTEAVRTKSQELVLGSSLADVMRALGLQPSGGRNGTITRLRKQAERLFMATLTMHWDDDDSSTGLRLGVASGYRLWKGEREGQLSFMPSFVRLSSEFYKEVTEHPVPLDLGALRALGGSPLRLDVYCWLTYRMSYLRRRTEVPWASLRQQFGSNNADTVNGRAQFRKDFLAALREVLVIYREANVEIGKTGVVLLPSRTHVPFKGLRVLANE